MKCRKKIPLLSHKIIPYQLHWPSQCVILKKQDTFKLSSFSRFRSQVSQFIQMGARSKVYCPAAAAETLSQSTEALWSSTSRLSKSTMVPMPGVRLLSQASIGQVLSLEVSWGFFLFVLLLFLLFLNPCVSKRGKRRCFCCCRGSFPGFDDAVLVASS